MKGVEPQVGDFYRKVLMDEMMKVVGVDLLDFVDIDGGQSYVRARSNCRTCTAKGACREWLVANEQGAPQDFCPNADAFRGLARDDR